MLFILPQSITPSLNRCPIILIRIEFCLKIFTTLSCSESECHSVMSDFLWSHGLYGPRNSPGQNTGVGSLSLHQGIFPIQGSNPGLMRIHIAGGFYTSWATRGRNTGVEDSLSLVQGIFPTQEVKPRSPTLQADSLPAEPQLRTQLPPLFPPPSLQKKIQTVLS